MFSELPPTATSTFAARLSTPPARLAAASISAGNTAGRLWAEGENGSLSSIVLWDQGNNILYLGLATDGDNDALGRIVDGEIRAAAVVAGLERFGIRALDDATERAIPRLLGKLISGERRTMFWEWPAGRAPETADPTLPGVQLQPIAAALLARDDIDGLADVRQEIGWMWPSIERYKQYGVGSAALLERQLICWCTAEYVGPQRCGVGIATAEQYRGLGLATATAGHFVRQALQRGLTPCWECGADNIPSARVAARLGFELLDQHHTWLGSFAKR